MIQSGIVLFLKYFREKANELGIDFQMFFDGFVSEYKVSYKDARDLQDLLKEEFGFELTLAEPEHRGPVQG